MNSDWASYAFRYLTLSLSHDTCEKAAFFLCMFWPHCLLVNIMMLHHLEKISTVKTHYFAVMFIFTQKNLTLFCRFETKES